MTNAKFVLSGQSPRTIRYGRQVGFVHPSGLSEGYCSAQLFFSGAKPSPLGKVPPKGAEEGGTTLDIQKQFGEMVFASSDLAGARPPSPEGKALLAKFPFTTLPGTTGRRGQNTHPASVTNSQAALWRVSQKPPRKNHPWWLRLWDCQLTSASVMARISFFCWGDSNRITLWILPSS